MNAELNLMIAWSVARWLEDEHGAASLADACAASGIEAADLDGKPRWTTMAKIEKFFASARDRAKDDDEFREACVHRFEETFGPMRYLLWATTPSAIYRAVVKQADVVTKISRYEIVEATRNRFHIKYWSDKVESRLLCLSRQAMWAAGPTQWGLPRASLSEESCIARGDECCEYDLRWYQKSRALVPFAGVACGLLAGLAVAPSLPTVAAAGLFGLAGTLVYELRRTNRENTRVAHEINSVLREVSVSETEARGELVELHRREREWTGIVEERIAARTAALENALSGLEMVQQSRVESLRGFSHDLRNPLFVLRGNTKYLATALRENAVVNDAELGSVLKDMEIATVRIERSLVDLMEIVTTDPAILQMTPQTIEVAGLVETYRRRLLALTYGRDLKVKVVFATQAPSTIEVDPMLLDRVVDNLLSNAAKYTRQGSIVVELGGTKGEGAEPMFTLKVSDTGDGIPAESIHGIFLPRTVSARRDASGYGVGLSSVVKLLAQLGGRLEVSSTPNVGTTFTAHVPSRVRPVEGARADDDLESIISRVVTVRAAS